MLKRRLVAVVFVAVMILGLSGLVKAEDLKVSGFAKVICNDAGSGVAPCGSSGLRIDARSESFFMEVEALKATGDDANWLRELMFSSRKGRTTLSAGRFFVAGSYPYPAPNSEVVTNPRIPVTFYGWGGRFKRESKNGNQIMLDVTGATDDLDGFRSGRFSDPELSVRFTHPKPNVSGQISGNIHVSKNFLRISTDYQYKIRDVNVRGALYDMQEGVGSDKFGGYVFAAKEVMPNMEIHLQTDYQDDKLLGSSAIWTIGIRGFNSKGSSLTIDREIFTDQKDQLTARFMREF